MKVEFGEKSGVQNTDFRVDNIKADEMKLTKEDVDQKETG